MNKRSSIIILILNMIIFILEIIGFFPIIRTFGFGMFKFYTQDSNLLLLITSFFYVIYVAFNWKKNIIEVPIWLQTLKYISAASVTVTFVVVVTILSWTMPFGLKYMLFDGSMLYHHTLCPILAIISFVFFEKYEFNSKIQVLRTLYFTFIYGIILIILNIVRIVEGPYPFLMVYNQPIWISVLWFLIIIGLALFSALILKYLNIKCNLTK